jgi:hypothetical protein
MRRECAQERIVEQQKQHLAEVQELRARVHEQEQLLRQTQAELKHEQQLRCVEMAKEQQHVLAANVVAVEEWAPPSEGYARLLYQDNVPPARPTLPTPESVRARTGDDGPQTRHANRTEVESATTISAKQQESRHEESEEALSTKRVENLEAATGTAVATTATTDAGPTTDSSVSEASFNRREASLDAGELSGSLLGVEEWDESGDLPLDASVAESSLEAVLAQARGTGSPNAAASRAAAAADDGGDLSISSSVREGRLAGVAVDEAETAEAAAGPATDSSVSEASFSRREASLDAGELSGSLGVEEWDESGDLPLDASVAESSWKVVSAEAPESKPDGVVNEQLVDMVTSSILEQLIVEEALALRTPHDSETSQGDVQEQRQHHQHQHEHPEEPGLSSAHQDEIVDQITSSILNQLVLQEVVAAMAGINE